MEIDSAAGVGISANDETDGINTIESAKLITAFDLALNIGTCDDDTTCATYTSLASDSEVDVGATVNVKLAYDDTKANGFEWVKLFFIKFSNSSSFFYFF